MQEDINQNLQKLSTWKRIFFMAIFAVIVSLVQIVLQLIILLQIASMLMTGNPNTNILSFGKKLSMYLYDIVLFLTFNSERLPFPFSEWSLAETLEKTINKT
ncbi:MAG: DUF4389 domain-containing protein [Methylococcales bacterium]|jgi:hypothetical protein|nr:DUF4389 domain-containing protein [Methylococcales bacterium]MBT3507435.1 DUF4389 domain-containing protein [Methylococcales bacterium]MBT3698948.1 DUF4389 domain-containing protein [Methylococcales bacterium]MBT3815008.1 DUF4389 domain-containing protein [Methylococcales bacterium]MBT4032949.1 DUF4389 domain-containing protein [Methylococcales bacterium]